MSTLVNRRSKPTTVGDLVPGLPTSTRIAPETKQRDAGVVLSPAHHSEPGYTAHRWYPPKDGPATAKFLSASSKPCEAHTLPAFSKAEAAALAAEAERVGAAVGWRARGSGLWTFDLTIDQLSAGSQTLVKERFKSKILPAARTAFGFPATMPDLPNGASEFFIIKYSAEEAFNADQSPHRKSLPIHTDSSALTVNVSLTDDYTGGGVFFPCKAPGAPEPRCLPCPGRSGTKSEGLVVKATAGIALLHDGEVKQTRRAIRARNFEVTSPTRASPPAPPSLR